MSTQTFIQFLLIYWNIFSKRVESNNVVYLCREVYVENSRTIVIKNRENWGWDFNPVTSLDAIFTMDNCKRINGEFS